MTEDQHSVSAQTPPWESAAAAGVKAGEPGQRPKPKRVRDGNGNLVPPTPYYVQASCELSEDYFLTEDVPIGADDKVMPFVNSQNNMVEAVVLTHDSNGQPSLAHLHRDPAATSGWTFTNIGAVPFGGVTDAAVSSSSTHNAMIMAVGPKNPNGLLPACQLSLLEDGSWTCGSNGWVPALAGPLGVGATAAGDLYWYGWTQQANSKTRNWDYTFWRWDGMGARAGVGGGIVVMVLNFALSSQTSPVTAHLMLDATVGGSTASYAVVMLNDVNSPEYGGYYINAYRLTDGNPDPTQVGTGNRGAASLLWSYVSAANTSGAPAQLWQDTDGDVSFIDETGAQVTIYDGGSVGAGQVAVWQLDDLYTFTILDHQSQVASVVTQIGNPVTGFTLPIPLAGGIDRIYSLPTDPAQGTLFAVDTLGTLNVLTKDPTLGWTQTQVHQDGVRLQPVTSWQTQISVLDANNNAVAGGKVQMTVDRPVGLWQADGSTILTPASPVTMTANGSGRIIASIPAQELDTAVLTAQALDSTGEPTGQPFTITPNIDVQNFLAGTHSLTDIGKLTNNALTKATIPVDPANPDGPQTTVFPNLTSASAGPVALAINHVATLGLQPKVAGAVQSAMFDLTTTPPTFHTSPSPNGFDSLRGQLGDPAWWDSAKNDAESAFHGLRHGLLEFKRMVTSWEKDTEQWVVNLTVDIGNGIDNVMTYVISDVKTAIHAISSFFHALGADIRTAWEWLKHNVLSLLKEAAANAAVISGLLSEGITQFTNVLSTIEKAADGFFTGQEANVTAKLGNLERDLGDASPGSAAPPPAPTSDTGANITDDLLQAGTDVAKILQKSPGWWLYNKIAPYLSPGAPGPVTNPATAAAVDTLLTDLVGDLAGSIDLVEDIYNMLDAAVKDKIHTSGDLSRAQLSDLVGDLGQIIHDALVLCDKLADTGLDAMKAALGGFDDILTTPLVMTVPLLSQILSFAKIDIDITVGQVLSMLIAFPATLISKVAFGTGVIFPDSPPAAGELGDGGPDKWGTALNLLSGVTQTIWAFVDEYEDLQSGVTPEGGGEAPSAPGWTSLFDFFCPYILAITGWPSAPLSTTQSAAPFGSFPGPPDTNETGLLRYIVAVNLIEPTAAAFAYSWKTGSKTEDQNSTFNTYFQPFGLIACGAAALVLNHIYLYANNGSTNDKCELVLGNLSNIFAWLGLQALIDASEGLSLLLKIIIDAVANNGTAICMFEDMCTAAGLNN